MIISSLQDRTDRLYDKAWRSIRIMPKFCISDLLRTKALETEEFDAKLISSLVDSLRKHQYISMYDENKVDNDFMFRKYTLINDIGPTVPSICDKCGHSLFSKPRIPITLQITLGIYWNNYYECNNIYLGLSTPSTNSGFSEGDYFTNILFNEIWQLERQRINTYNRLGNERLKYASSFYYSVNYDHFNNKYGLE